MEERRFDDLTRALGKATSRRGVLKGLLGGAFGLIAFQAREPRAIAAPAYPGVPCDVRSCDARAESWYATDCIKETCGKSFRAGQFGFCALSCWFAWRQRRNYCRDSQGCDLGNLCSNGLCCDREYTNCDGQCSDTSSDSSNCGACGNQCLDSGPCVNSVCQTCLTGQTLCTGPYDHACCGPQEECQISSNGSAECIPSCDTCWVYDESEHSCLPTEDGTECGSGLICQSGQCVTACPDLCSVYQNGQCVPAPNGTPCVADTGTTYECCNGECYHPVGVPCCAPDVETCGDTCCGTNEGCTYVEESDPAEYVCCPESGDHLVGNALPGGACCPAGQDTFNMRDCPPDFPDRWICCPIEDDRGLTGCCSYGS